MSPGPATRSHIIDTDVVVVGSGGAGLCAAAAADQAGARVVLVTKGRAGAGNATAYAGGGFTVSPPRSVSGDDDDSAPGSRGRSLGLLTPDEHFALSIRAGRGLPDRILLGELCRKGTASLEELERDFGVRFHWGPAGCSVFRYGRPPLLGGVGLTRPLVAHLRRRGVFILEETVVTHIVQDGGPGRGQVLGVLGVNTGEATTGGEGTAPVVEVRAPAVVVATGGGGAIYGRTDNPRRMTGDGYGLLARAGAILEDMEFVQFYPLGVAEPGLSPRLIGAEVLDFVRLSDETGRDPLDGKLEEWGVRNGTEVNLYARDKAAVHLSRCISEGHELYLHTEELASAKAPKWALRRIASACGRTFDPFSRPIRVAPLQHYFCGGAVINARGEVMGAGRAVLPGLFACGETTGGVDGANRVGGNALVNIVVFGLASGRAAARHASAVNAGGMFAGGRARAWEEPRGELRSRLSKWLGPTRGASVLPGEVRDQLNLLCDRLLGPVREARTLAEALDDLGRLAGQVKSLAVRSPADLLIALELDFSIETATLVAAGALFREESRGAHFRQDYPSEDASWLGPVTIGLGPAGPVAERGTRPLQGWRDLGENVGSREDVP